MASKFTAVNAEDAAAPLRTDAASTDPHPPRVVGTVELRKDRHPRNLHEIDGDNSDPVAICGFSIKLPDDATCPEGFWKILEEKRCVMKEFPANRLNIGGFYQDEDRANSFRVKGGHFINEDLSVFDADFFSISPAEAIAMDPLQRWLLETTFRALENAGMPLDLVSGSSTAVYTGAFGSDYTTQMYRDPETSPKYASVGLGLSMLANRLSWFYNLKGPSIGLDTACSSSATAFDIACRSLRDKSCDMSIVAGCNLTFAPEVYTTMTNLDFLSADSRCYSFDHRAQGYARGEGIVVMVLKRLSDAIRHGDVVRAVVRSTGCNEDGRTPGITQPSGEAQERLIRETYKKAQLELSHTRYFEAHGTGTAIGDPREAQAIGLVFRHHRSAQDPLFVGAVKSNIGHLEGASGLAGIVKAVLVLEKGIIPPNANFEKANPKIDSEYLRLKFPESRQFWPTPGLRRASVNSFGYGGANSHIVLDDAYNYMRLRCLKGKHHTDPAPRGDTNGMLCEADRINGAAGHQLQLMVWSASDKDGLARMSRLYDEYLNEQIQQARKKEDFLADFAYTLDSRRSHLSWRAFALFDSSKDLAEIFSGMSSPTRALSSPPRVGFVFSGQGAQWCGMANELVHYRSFKAELDLAGAYFRSLGCSWDVLEELTKPREISRIDEAQLSQPLCTVVQIALVNLLREFSVWPTAVVGHSSGEIAAAYAGGYLTGKSAWRLAYFRGLCSAQLEHSTTSPDRGAMLAIGAPESQLRAQIKELDSMRSSYGLSLACTNSPTSITVSGEEKLISILKGRLDEQDIFARKLRVSVAYHSRQMHYIREKYDSMIQDLRSPDHPNRVLMISSVTGKPIQMKRLLEPSYWTSNLVSEVKFEEAVTYMCSHSDNPTVKKLDRSHMTASVVDQLVEVGPHSVLQSSIKDILRAIPRTSSVGYNAMLKRNHPAVVTVLQTLGHLHCIGYNVNLRAVNAPPGTPSGSLLVDLPEYPFDHCQHFWHESRLSQNYRLREYGPSELIGVRTNDWDPSHARWRHFIRPANLPWVDDHIVDAKVLFPAAGMIAMAIEGVKQIAQEGRGIGGFFLQDVRFSAPIELNPQSPEPEVQLSLRKHAVQPDHDPSWDFNIKTYEDKKWLTNCQGRISVELTSSYPDDWKIQKAYDQRKAVMARFSKRGEACNMQVDSQTMYKFLRQQGYGYGPAFQGLNHQRCSRAREAIAQVRLFRPCSTTLQQYIVHPVSLDTIFHLGLTARSTGGSRTMDTSIPASIRNLWVSGEGLSWPDQDSVLAHAIVEHDTKRGFFVEGLATDCTNRPVLWYDGFELRTIANKVMVPVLPNPRQCHMAIHFKPALDKMSMHETVAFLKAKHPPYPRRTAARQNLERLVTGSLKQLIASVRIQSPDILPMWQNHYWRWAHYHLRLEEDEPVENLEELEYAREIARQTPLGNIYALISSNLVKIFNNQVTPMELFVGAGQFKDLYHFEYSSSATDQMCSYLNLLAHQHPGMNILEVGGGTGGGTKIFLEALSHQSGTSRGSLRCSMYHFTDISPTFLPAMQETLRNNASQVRFSTLDIAQDLAEQGQEMASYDIVLGVDVFHLPSDLTMALTNMRRILKPGGKLIMREIFEPTGWTVGFVFGLFPGWWTGVNDKEGRTLGPSLTVEHWDLLLRKAGFNGVDICFHDTDSLLTDGKSGWLIASVREERLETLALPQAILNAIIVISSSSQQQRAFAEDLLDPLKSIISGEIVIMGLEEDVKLIGRSQHEIVISLLAYDPSYLRTLEQDTWPAFQTLISSANHQLWISSVGCVPHPDGGILEGLARTLRSEHYDLHLVTLMLQGREASANTMSHVMKVVEEMISTTDGQQYEQEYIENDGFLHTRRLVEAQFLKTTIDAKVIPYKLVSDILKRQPPFAVSFEAQELGDLPHFVQAPMIPGSEEALTVMVRAVVLDTSDTALLSRHTVNDDIGSFCVGFVIQTDAKSSFRLGDRVLLSLSGSFRSHLRVNSSALVAIPPTLSYAEACLEIPPMWAALRALTDTVQVKSNSEVLVYDGTSPIGQAAIKALSHLGVSEVWVTAADKSDSDWISDVLQVPQEHIIPKEWFLNRPMLVSHLSRKFDLVLQADMDHPERLLMSLVKERGHYVTFDASWPLLDRPQTIYAAPSNIQLSTICLHQLSTKQNASAQKSLVLAKDLAALSTSHKTSPRQVTSYRLGHLSRAIDHLQRLQKTERILVELDNMDVVDVYHAVEPVQMLDCDSSYVVVGGLGGLGRAIARWLVSRGARFLILLSRSGPKTTEAISLLEELRHKGICVDTPECDATQRDTLESVLRKCLENLPRVRGCIIASMVLKEHLFQGMSFDDWKTVLEPKVLVSWNIHCILPRGLDFFVLLSSIAGIVGRASLAAYNAGNVYQDWLANYRNLSGEPSTSLNLGGVADEGYLKHHTDRMVDFQRLDQIEMLYMKEIYAMLDYHCHTGSVPVGDWENRQHIVGVRPPAHWGKGQDIPFPLAQPLWQHMHHLSGTNGISALQGNVSVLMKPDDIAKSIVNAQSMAKAVVLASEALLLRVSTTLAIPKERLELETPLISYGIDSLSAMDLRNWIGRVFNVDIPIFDIQGGTSVAKVAQTIASRKRGGNGIIAK